MTESEKQQTGQPQVRNFWLRVLGWILMLGSVGVVSCQALFNL
jgi:hypothetical protein